MKTIAALLLVLSSYTLKAQISNAQIKNDLAGKEWKIVKYESFNDNREASDDQSNDKIVLNKDMTCAIVENGKEHSGNWSIEPEAHIACKSKPDDWSRLYKVISIADKTATLEYKDQNLTRTLYRLESK